MLVLLKRPASNQKEARCRDVVVQLGPW